MFQLEVKAMKGEVKSNLNPNIKPGVPYRERGMSNTKFLLLVTISLFVLLYIISAIVFTNSNFTKWSVFFNLFNNKAYLLMLAWGSLSLL